MIHSSTEWLIIVFLILTNTFAYILVLRKIRCAQKNSKQSKDEATIQEITNYKFATTIVAFIMLVTLAIIVLVVLKPGKIESLAIVSVLVLSTIYGESNGFKRFETLDNILRLSSNSRITVQALLYYVELVGMSICYLHNNLAIYIKELSLDSTFNQFIFLVYDTGLHFILISFSLCSIFELYYYMAYKKFIFRIKRKASNLKRMIHSQIPSEFYLNKRGVSTFSNSIVTCFFFIIDSIYTAIEIMISIIIVAMESAYIIAQGGFTLLRRMFQISYDNEDNSIGTSKSLKLILGWSLILALLVTYLSYIGSGFIYKEIISAFSFIVSIIVVPLVIGTIISYGNNKE